MGILFIDLSGPKSKKSLTVPLYVMIIVDDFPLMKWVRLILPKYQAGEELRNFIADVLMLEELAIGAVPTDEGEKVQDDFQIVLM